MKKYYLITILSFCILTPFYSFADGIDLTKTSSAISAFKFRAPCANFKDIQIPNVFSPNNDGNNDVFYLQGWDLCIQNYEMAIYNRWGIKIFESTNVNVEWDGRILTGTEAPEGTYYYIFNIKNINGEDEKLSGFITLVR